MAGTTTLPWKQVTNRSDTLHTGPLAGGIAIERYVAQCSEIMVGGWWSDGKGLIFWIDPEHTASIATAVLPLYSLFLVGGAPREFDEVLSILPAGRQLV